MPGVGQHGTAARFVADGKHAAKQDLFARDHRAEHDQRERLGGVMGNQYFPHGKNHDADRCADQHQGDDGRGDRVGLAVSVGIVLVGRLAGDFEPAPDDERRKDVGRRFDGVGDEGVRIAQETGHEFDRDQGHVRQ